MIALVTQRTKVSDSTKILRELNSAQRWTARRVFNSADGPDLLVVIGEELAALGSTTRTLDIGATITGLKFSSGYYLPPSSITVGVPDVLVTINSTSGAIVSLAPYAATQLKSTAPTQPGVIQGPFSAIYDGRGKNLAPGGALR